MDEERSPIAPRARALIRRGFLALLIIVLGLPVSFLWGRHRIELGEANVSYSRKISETVVETAAKRANNEGLIRGIASLFGAKGVADAVFAAGSSANRDGLVTDARQCSAAVSRSYGISDLVFFDQPASCQAMLRTLGLPMDMEQVTGGFGSTLARAAKLEPGSVGGPPCPEWRVSEVHYVAPTKKADGQPWDADNSAPDLVASVEVDGKRIRAPKQQNSGELRWTFPSEFGASQLKPFDFFVDDADLLSPDPIEALKITIPGNLPNTRRLDLPLKRGSLSFTVRCPR